MWSRNDGHIGRVERRVMGAITACRTAALGGHVEQCDDCGATRIAYNSCRNRHCPTCQGTDGQEEPRLAGHPALSIERGSAARYDAMDVGMMLECLPPGMEDGEDAEFGFEMARIGGELHQCRSGGTEQDGVDRGLVLEGDLGRRGR